MTEPQQFLIYQSEDGSTRINVMLDAETLWLSQKQLTALFGKPKGTISEHIKHIYEDGELTHAATVRLFRTVQSKNNLSNSRLAFWSCPMDAGWIKLPAYLKKCRFVYPLP